MADHLHQQILVAYQATLVAAATSAGSDVFLDRLDEVPQASLPALVIRGRGETIKNLVTDWTPIQQRAYSFTITCLVGQSSGAPAAARNLAKQVEQALFASQSAATAAGKAKQLRLDGSQEELDGNAAVPLFAVVQTWTVDLVTLAGTPDAAY